MPYLLPKKKKNNQKIKSLKTFFIKLKHYYFHQNICVANDTAERGVKLIQKFNGLLTSNEEQRQFLLQCVENHRKQFPDCKKATLKRNLNKYIFKCSFSCLKCLFNNPIS